MRYWHELTVDRQENRWSQGSQTHFVRSAYMNGQGTLAGTEEKQWLSGPCWTGLESDSKWALHNCFCMSSENVWKGMMGAKLYEYTKKITLDTTTGLRTSKEGMLAVLVAVKLVKRQLNNRKWPWRCSPVVSAAWTAEAGESHVWSQPGPSQNKREQRVWLGDRIFAKHGWGPRFSPQHYEDKTKLEKETKEQHPQTKHNIVGWGEWQGQQSGRKIFPRYSSDRLISVIHNNSKIKRQKSK